MALSGVLRGVGSSLKKGQSGSETAVAGVTQCNIQLVRNTVVHHAAGDEDAYAISTGNRVVTGNISKFLRDDNTIAEVLGGTKTINFVGINKGGSTHIIEDAEGTWVELNVAPGSFPGSEIESTEYDNIESNNATYDSLTAATTGDYAAFMVKFDSIGTEATIDFVQLIIDGYGTGPIDGFDVYVYNQTSAAWVACGQSSGGAAGSELVVTISDIPTTDYVDASGDIYFMIRSRSAGTAGTDNVLYLDYLELIVKDSGNTFLDEFQFVITNTDGSNTETFTIAGVKWDNYSFEFDNTAEAVVESITFKGTSLTTS